MEVISPPDEASAKVNAPLDHAVADPDWPAESKIVQEALLFVRTFRSVANHPGRFVAEWAAGRQEALNPLTYYVLSFAIAALAIKLIAATRPADGNATDPQSGALFGYVFVALSAAWFHFIAFRKTGRPFRTTLGAVLFGMSMYGALASVLASAFMTVMVLYPLPAPFGLIATFAFVTTTYSLLIVAMALAVSGVVDRPLAHMIAWGLGYMLMLVLLYVVVFAGKFMLWG